MFLKQAGLVLPYQSIHNYMRFLLGKQFLNLAYVLVLPQTDWPQVKNRGCQYLTKHALSQICEHLNPQLTNNNYLRQLFHIHLFEINLNF